MGDFFAILIFVLFIASILIGPWWWNSRSGLRAAIRRDKFHADLRSGIWSRSTTKTIKENIQEEERLRKESERWDVERWSWRWWKAQTLDVFENFVLIIFGLIGIGMVIALFFGGVFLLDKIL